MKCRNCGTEIAEKALICYRCGESTTTPRVKPPEEPPARGPWLMVLVVLAIIGAAVLALPQLQPGTPRYLGWVAVFAATVVAVWALRPRKRRRLLK